MFGQHLGGVATIVRQVGCAHVITQAAFQRSSAGNAFLQHLDAHTHIGHRVKRSESATYGIVLVGVYPCHHLHQPLGAHRALGKGIEARLNGHDGQNQRGVEFGACTQFVGFCHQQTERLGRNAVFFAQPEGHASLLLGELLGIDGQGAVAGFQGGGLRPQ